jgi:hypothetical protein
MTTATFRRQTFGNQAGPGLSVHKFPFIEVSPDCAVNVCQLQQVGPFR